MNSVLHYLLNFETLKAVENKFLLADCMNPKTGLPSYPDSFFDLAIVDPPYGIGQPKQANLKGYNGRADLETRLRKNRLNSGGGKLAGRILNRANTEWDNAIPSDDYFYQLFRTSKNQIIWGGNYFGNLWPCRGYLIWDKGTGENSYADCELAWSSIDGVSKIYSKSWVGANAKDTDGRYHPTQKPVNLYRWILKTFAKEGDKILDTHLGSGSIAIACHDYKFDLVASEIDKEYYDATMKRVSNHLAQTVLF